MVLHRKALAGAGISVGAALGIAGPAQAAPFEVNSADDPGVDGICDVTECTLREAIDAADVDAVADQITFAAGLTGSTITLDPGVGYGRLVIDEPVDIQGLGADSLTVSGGDATGLFGVYPNTPGDDVTISGLTLTGGLVDDDDGGAIKSYDADLFVEDAVVSGNTAGGVGGASDEEGGGGIAAEYGTLVITDSTISQNNAPEEDGEGGGILAQHVGFSLDGSTLSGNSADGEDGYGGGMFLVDTGASITGSTVSGNTALGGDEAAAGGIFTAGGPLGYSLEVVDSTISGNQTSGDPGNYGAGAGLYTYDVLTTFDNSTLSGNTGNFYGGAIAARYGSLTARNSTIAGNTAYGGGGIAAAVITATLENTIVADNVATVGPDLVGDFDAAFSLIEDATNPGSITTTVPNSNLFGQDPLLAVLADNGGPDSGAPGMLVPIETQLPLGTSPAVDCGRSFGETEDQRGEGRPVQLSPPNSTAAGADGADIGAVELQMLGGPGRTTPCILPTPPPPPPPPNLPTPAATPASGFDLAAAIKRCKKRFHGKRRKKCIKKARGQAKATIAQPGWPEPRSFRDR